MRLPLWVLIDDLMMNRIFDLEAGDVLELVLARKRNPCFEMLRSRRNRDLGVVGETEVALAVGRSAVVRREHCRREQHEHGQRNERDFCAANFLRHHVVATLRGRRFTVP